MDQWLKKRLADCLGFDVPEEMIELVLHLIYGQNKLFNIFSNYFYIAVMFFH